jgi:hypothetical protein
MRPEQHYRPAPPRRGPRPAVAEPKAVGAGGSRRSAKSAVAEANGEGGSERRNFQPSVPTARPNHSRINTSANSSFFIKSLIINDLKSNRISKRACKSTRINTSEIRVCKSLRINTSRRHRGEGVGVSLTVLKLYLKFAVILMPRTSRASPACRSKAPLQFRRTS